MRVNLGVLRDEIHGLLAEGRVDDAREKFPDMDEDVFNRIVANQPTGSNNKYLMWSVAQADALLEVDPDPQGIDVVIRAVRLFDSNQQRLRQKDINQYKSTEEVEQAVEALGEKAKSKGGDAAAKAKSSSDLVYKDDRFLVLRPYTAEASQKLGANTNWCIAASGGGRYFTSYSESNNKFYFVIDQQLSWDAQRRTGDNKAKFAIAYISDNSIQVYNSADNLVSLKAVQDHVGEKWPAMWAKIQEHVKAHPTTREVEEAQKGVEEVTKALLNDEPLGEGALAKIAQKGKLSNTVVRALISKFNGYDAPTDWYRDKRSGIMSALAERSGEMSPEAAMATLKWIAGARPAGGAYWSGHYLLERMMKSANLTAQGFNELAETNDETVLAFIFQNAAAPEDLKTRIVEKLPSFQSEEAGRNIYWELIKTGKITLDQFRTAMAKDNRRGYNYLVSNILSHADELDLPPEMIRLIPVRDVYGFKNLMKLKNLPGNYAIEVLTRLMASGEVKKYDAYQFLKTLPLDVADLERFWAANKSQEVRTSLLQNPAIGAGNAAQFAKSKNSAYRFAVAHNSVTPAASLTTLSTDESVSTRSAVAANPNASSEILTRLAGDEAVAVRASVASNPKAPRDILDALRRDSDDFVRKSARKTLKSLEANPAPTAEARDWLSMKGMLFRGILREALEDDETPDIMNPHWRDLPEHGIHPPEFIAVFLLQNNGAATREEIVDAYQTWQGAAGAKELWKTGSQGHQLYKGGDEIIRGITAGGKGWFWSPAGINKGALFRLTPAGASAALEVLARFRNHNAVTSPKASVTSATAKPGKTYWIPTDREALDITGYQNADISREELQVDGQGNLIKQNGKVQKLNPDRSRRQHRLQRGATFFKVETPAGEIKYLKEFPKVQVPANTKVTFVKPHFGLPTEKSSYNRERNKAIVKVGERFLLVDFPLWAMEHGEVPATKEREVMPPPKKSPPPGAAPARAAGAPRPTGPKVSYKIYGKKAGKSAHTRLKGQAYGAPADTQFTPGEQAVLQPTDDGKLKVKKTDSDHEQTWDPVEG